MGSLNKTQKDVLEVGINSTEVLNKEVFQSKFNKFKAFRKRPQNQLGGRTSAK